jgi:hypothetical protein
MFGCLLVALCLYAVPSSAQAQTCYPPPCASNPSSTDAGPSAPDVNASLISATGEGHARSAAPFAVTGLLMVTTMLTVLCLQRRAAMAVDGGVGLASTGSGLVSPPAEHDPARSLV